MWRIFVCLWHIRPVYLGPTDRSYNPTNNGLPTSTLNVRFIFRTHQSQHSHEPSGNYIQQRILIINIIVETRRTITALVTIHNSHIVLLLCTTRSVFDRCNRLSTKGNRAPKLCSTSTINVLVVWISIVLYTFYCNPVFFIFQRIRNLNTRWRLCCNLI